MSDSSLVLANPPIVEAVLDLDCDLPPSLDLPSLEGAVKNTYSDRYPIFKTLFFQEAKIPSKPELPAEMTVRHGLQAFQCFDPAEKQLVQVRMQGYSFNRLTPYTSMDDYLPEIERTWRLFLKVICPVQLGVIRLRYINRILLPLTEGRVDLEQYLKINLRPANDDLRLAGFLNQYTAVESGTGHEVNVVVTSQPPEKDRLPVIFDNCVACTAKADPQDWSHILAKIQSLRGLKNRVFKNTLTDVCLNLFR